MIIFIKIMSAKCWSFYSDSDVLFNVRHVIYCIKMITGKDNVVNVMKLQWQLFDQ